MKNGLSLVLGVLVLVSCSGCKSTNGLDIIFGMNPLDRVAQVRFKPMLEEDDKRTMTPQTGGVEVRFNIKRDSANLGSEDISLDIRIPGDAPAAKPAAPQPDSQKPVQRQPELLAAPALLSQR